MTMERLLHLIAAMWLVGVDRQDIEKGVEDLSPRRRLYALNHYDEMERAFKAKTSIFG